MKNKKQNQGYVAFLLIAAMLLFVIFNFTTTKETLENLFGPGLAIVSFSIAVSLVDFAGIARIFVRSNGARTTDDVGDFKKLLTVVWLIAILVDIGLTYLWGVERISPNLQGQDKEIGQIVGPLMIAISEVTIRVPLVIAVTQQWKNLFTIEELREPSQSPTRQQIHRPPQQSPNYYRPVQSKPVSERESPIRR